MSSFVPVDTTIDIRIYMVKHDPFVASARYRIQKLTVEKGHLENLIKNAEQAVRDYDDQIADIEAQIADYVETGNRGHALAVDDEPHIRVETKRLIKKAHDAADRQLRVELAKVQVPKGWGCVCRINSKGHAEVILTSEDQICPDEMELQSAVRRQFKELREHQAQMYHPNGLGGQPNQPVPDRLGDNDQLPPWMTPPKTGDP